MPGLFVLTIHEISIHLTKYLSVLYIQRSIPTHLKLFLFLTTTFFILAILAYSLKFINYVFPKSYDTCRVY